MSYLIIETKDKNEEKFIQEVLKKMNVKVMTEEEENAKEEAALVKLYDKGKRSGNKRYSLETIKADLKKRK